MNYQREKVIDKLLSSTGLFESIFGKAHDMIILNEKKEHIKHYLYTVFWFSDVYDIFPKELDDDMTERYLKTMFTYYDNEQWQWMIQANQQIR